jgi:PKD repeat protein
VSDADGGEASDSFTVTVGNLPPLVEGGPGQTAAEGVTVSLPATTFSDAGILDTHAATIDWGDGTGPVPASVTEPVPGGADGSVSASHVYADDGSYVVEVVVTDADGGTGRGSFTVVVTNAAPVVQAGPDRAIAEGASVALAPATFTDAGTLDSHTATIDWGDGSTPVNGTVSESPSGPPGDPAGMSGSVDAAHTYGSDGVFTVTVTVTDDDGGVGSDSFTVTVSAGDIVVDAGADRSADEGAAVAVSAVFDNLGAFNSHGASIDWGDGTPAEPAAVTEPGAGGNAGAASGSHVYAEDGVYTVTVTVTDDDGDTGADSLVVTVRNVAPAVNAGPDESVDEGQALSFSGSFTDPGVLDTHTIAWDFGDGTGAGGTLTPVHTYAEDGTYTVTLTVTDDEGGVGSDTLVVTVRNALPAVNAGADQAASEGGVVSFVGSFTDSGVLDTHTIVWDFGDGTGASGTLTPAHTYADDGVYTVVLTVTDDDGGAGSDTLRVSVANQPPVLAAGADRAVDAGEPVSLAPQALFADPGTLDSHTATVDWGDGGGPEPAAVTESPFGPPGDPAGMSGSIAGSHAYSTAGVFTVTVTVVDDEGGADVDSFEVTVRDINPPEQTVFDLLARAKSTKIDLVWTPVPGASAYNVYRGTSPGGPYQLISAGHLCSYCAYADYGLTNGTTYYYVVTSIAGGVESLFSNEASATPVDRIRRR